MHFVDDYVRLNIGILKSMGSGAQHPTCTAQGL